MSDPRLPLSVIVPTRNTRALTLRCLAALDAAGGQAAEVIVVDDGGRDGTGEAVRSRFPSVRVVTRVMSGGFTAAVNDAWPLATREIVLLLNSDTEVAADALTGFAAAFAADPRLGVAGASLRHPDGRPQWSAGREPSTAWLFALASGAAAALGRMPGWRRVRRESQARGHRGHARENADASGRPSGVVGASGDPGASGRAGLQTNDDAEIEAHGHLHPSRGARGDAPDHLHASGAGVESVGHPGARGRVGIDADWVPATAMAVRREVRAAIGLFDPLFATYAQDLDYCTRARAAGWRVAQLPNVTVMHVLGGTIGGSRASVGDTASADDGLGADARMGPGSGGGQSSADRAVTSRQDPRALLVDLSRWIRKRHADAPARARRLQRALAAGLAARISARRLMRPFVRDAARTAWDRETTRYREAAVALAHETARHARASAAGR